MSRIWAYLRVSTEQQANSLDRTRFLAAEKAKELIAKGGRFNADQIYSEQESAFRVRWNNRPQFQALMKAMDQGDSLIVESLDRLDREWDLLQCLCFIHNRKITLYLLLEGGKQFDFGNIDDRFMALMSATESNRFMSKLITRTREALQWRKKMNLVYSRRIPIGHKKITLRRTPGQKKPYKKFVWDEKQCALLREAVHRRDILGESFLEIGIDFEERGEKTASDASWVLWIRPQERWSTYNLRIAYHKFKEMLANGGGPGDTVPAIKAAKGTSPARIASGASPSREVS